ncbi:MAG: class I SAM-dependent methyltransferase [Deltaproteobacteria bacterium]|nr:class I SAM-dependent methyltransferase [Deltaproteobacteria bacterium]
MSPRGRALDRGAVEHYLDPTYYDHSYRRRVDDVAFYRAVARAHGGPILELGAGSGRVSVPLALDGHAVTGLDASTAMLRQARAHAKERGVPRGRLSLRRGDFRRFALDRSFKVVLAPFNALLHLYEPSELLGCFRAVGKHLSRGGRFVFDVRVPQLRELLRDPGHAYAVPPFRHPTLGCKVAYSERYHYDPTTQVQTVTFRFVPEDGTPPYETVLTHRMLFSMEVKLLLEATGFALESVHGDFHGGALTDDATEAVYTARRR